MPEDVSLRTSVTGVQGTESSCRSKRGRLRILGALWNADAARCVGSHLGAFSHTPFKSLSGVAVRTWAGGSLVSIRRHFVACGGF